MKLSTSLISIPSCGTNIIKSFRFVRNEVLKTIELPQVRIITDRVSSTRREVIVSLCQSTPTGGEYPSQGVPKYPLARSGPRGVPQLRRVPRYPPIQVRSRGTPSRGGGGYPGQHMEYLISGSRYVSCVHAGGLSCCQTV